MWEIFSKVHHHIHVHILLDLVHLQCMLMFPAPGSGFSVAGRIESGHVQVGESVLVLPVGDTATVKSE